MSDPEMSGLQRMLMQGMAFVRIVNSLLEGRRNYFVIVICITDELIAKRYVLYLKNKEARQVTCVQISPEDF